MGECRHDRAEKIGGPLAADIRADYVDSGGYARFRFGYRRCAGEQREFNC
jgi:hypothetical protein